MKIVIANSICPFSGSTPTPLVSWLSTELKKLGHGTEIFEFPFRAQVSDFYDQMLALRLFELGPFSDLLITLDEPSFLLPHPNKVVWYGQFPHALIDSLNHLQKEGPSESGFPPLFYSLKTSLATGIQEAKKVFVQSQHLAFQFSSLLEKEVEVLSPLKILQNMEYPTEAYLTETSYMIQKLIS
jgi:hypothetical protein